MIVGGRSNGRSKRRASSFTRCGQISTLHQRSNGCDLIAPFRSNDAYLGPLIAMRPLDQRLRPIFSLNKIVLRERKLALGFSRLIELFRHHNSSVITWIYNLNSYLISLIFMLILCNYDACYRNFMNFLHWNTILLKFIFMHKLGIIICLMDD